MVWKHSVLPIKRDASLFTQLDQCHVSTTVVANMRISPCKFELTQNAFALRPSVKVLQQTLEVIEAVVKLIHVDYNQMELRCNFT